MTSIFFLTETIYCNMFRCKYLRKKKVFLNIFLHFRSLDSILKIFKKKMTLIADVILNLRTPKMWLDKCLKSPVSEHPSTSNMVNGSKHSWNLNYLYHIYWGLWRQLSWKKSLLVIEKILGLFSWPIDWRCRLFSS